MNQTQKIAVIALGVFVVFAACAMAFSDEKKTIEPNAANEVTVSFYFTDNFDNDEFECMHTYPTDAQAIIPGIWIKGTGTDMESALKNACKNFNNASITISGGKITAMNGVKDGNLYIWAWDGAQWISQVSGHYLTLNDLDISEYTYVAIVHGSTDKSGNAPEVNATPADIEWYYGDSITPGKGGMVTFFLSNNFVYSMFESSKADHSDITTLLVPGIWIRGYATIGSTVLDAFTNALDRIGYTYDVSESGFINYVNNCTGGNFLQAIWDDTNGEWFPDTNSHYFMVDYVGDVHYASLVYGAWGGEGGYTDPPWPVQDATDCNWAY